MKVRAVNPGHISLDGDKWRYSIIYSHSHGAHEQLSDNSYHSPNTAKQAMREKVAQERKKHCV